MSRYCSIWWILNKFSRTTRISGVVVIDRLRFNLQRKIHSNNLSFRRRVVHQDRRNVYIYGHRCSNFTPSRRYQPLSTPPSYRQRIVRNEGCPERCPASRNPLNSLSNSSNIQWVSAPQRPQFQRPHFFRPSLFSYLSLSRIIISQLFRRIKKKKRIRLRGNPIFRCVIFLLRGSQIAREIFARHPRLRIHYFKHANILSTRILLLVMQISIRNLRKIDR